MLNITGHRKFSDIKEKLKDIIDLEIYVDKREIITYLVRDKQTGELINSFTCLEEVEENYSIE